MPHISAYLSCQSAPPNNARQCRLTVQSISAHHCSLISEHQ
ncbi:unnamed protein product [Staurois parvus]|uniref:Uncharacterized protein n=1 Tax=Staurois parvus TaxID=386267 RepID=A0ABN9ANR9_9NEOB|nr:unnamed protein product [Staurois parvus]